MTLEITLPFGKKTNVKSLVFTILTKEYPLKIIELTNFIRKRYGKSVTFQAVRKALLELVNSKILVKDNKTFYINKEWVKESKRILDELYLEIYEGKKLYKKEESIEGEISVFTFNSLNEMIKFWQNLIDEWFKNFKPGNPNINVYQAAHAWEGLLHLDRESRLMGQLKKKGIKSYILSTDNTPLDKNIRKFYLSIGVKMYISPSSSSFDKSYYVGTYGDMIIESRYPRNLVKELDNFFKINKTIENLSLNDLSKIVNKRSSIKLTVIKNLEMAKQINKSIISQIKS
ncbi:MAG: hypothetical protein AABW56_02375 [Nanoarchaeota archaeon]